VLNIKVLIFLICLFTSIHITQRVSADENTVDYNSKAGIAYLPFSGVTPPVNPENPNTSVDPINPDGTKPNQGTGGELSIDFASSLDFGMNEISNKNQVYFAQAQKYYKSSLITPNFIQVTDNRGTLKGWTLKVYEKVQLRAQKAPKYEELKGASMSFLKPTLVTNGDAKSPKSYEVMDLIPGVETLIAQADSGEGGGTWLVRWGSKKELFKKELLAGEENIERYFTSAVSLYVPGSTPKEAADYRTNLTWILSELPDNQ
jgi:hypothetical protein